MTALPLATARSLRPAFAPARVVSLAVKPPFAFALHALISNQRKVTFARLRYSFGGDRPSQTAHLTLSTDRFHGPGLEPQNHKGGISLVAPHRLTPTLQSLPPMLHMQHRDSLSGCSKGPRGLSVLLRVTGIFTGATNSLSRSPRQRPDRYAIRAGRNLPDKEFRYLRTVIVTAAVYRGFDSELRRS